LSRGKDELEGTEGGELELEPWIHGRAADVVKAIRELLVVSNDVVVPVARGKGLHGEGGGGPAVVADVVVEETDAVVEEVLPQTPWWGRQMPGACPPLPLRSGICWWWRGCVECGGMRPSRRNEEEGYGHTGDDKGRGFGGDGGVRAMI
jgi:hypothetical protein